MSTAVQPVRGFKLSSTNGIGTVVTLFILAAGAAFGISEDVIMAFILAGTPIILAVREIFQGIRKPRWVGNIVTYVTSALVLIAPWLSDVFELASPIAEALAAGNFNAVWPMLIPFVGALLLAFKTRREGNASTSKATISTT